jgi:hypothetical protein
MLTPEEVEKLLRKIYLGIVNPLALPKKLYKKIGEKLSGGLYKGYGKNIVDVEYDSPDFDMLKHMRENVYLFSSAKTFNYVLASEGLITEGDKVLPFTEFKKRAKEVYDKYNDAWLKAEYETAIGSGQIARAWNDFAPDAILKYSTAKDSHVSDVCRSMEGVTRPKNDPIWFTNSPLQHYNCFTPETLVLTKEGWRRIDQIKVGDIVIGGSGQDRKVEVKHVNKVNTEIVRLSTKNNSVSTTKNHRILTTKGWIKSEKIKPFDIIIDHSEATGFNKAVCNINNVAVLLAHYFMSFVCKWKTRAINAFNGYIEFWDKYIYKFAVHKFVADSMNPVFCKIFQKLKFMLGWFFVVLLIPFWIFKKCFFSFLHNPFSGYFIKHWVVFSHSLFGNWMFFAKPRVRNSNHGFAHNNSGILSPFRVIDPLSFYSFATMPWSEAKVSKKPHKSSIVDAPDSADFSKSEHIGEIQSEEGFTGGAPLDGFNSLFNFVRHSVWHRKFKLVRSVHNIQYSGDVFNLAVEKDASYITKIGIVHNCRCVLLSSSLYEVRPVPKTVLMPPKEFAFNPGIEKQVYDKSHPYFSDIPSKYKTYAKENFGQNVPRIPKK